MADVRGAWERLGGLYEEAEKASSKAAERIVASNSFGELLAQLTENAMALTRIGNDMLDMGVRNLRLASRNDLTRLGRQLARTEDKLEAVLQEVERLNAQLGADGRDGTTRARAGTSNAAGSTRKATASPRKEAASPRKAVSPRRAAAGGRPPSPE